MSNETEDALRYYCAEECRYYCGQQSLLIQELRSQLSASEMLRIKDGKHVWEKDAEIKELRNLYENQIEHTRRMLESASRMWNEDNDALRHAGNELDEAIVALSCTGLPEDMKRLEAAHVAWKEACGG